MQGQILKPYLKAISEVASYGDAREESYYSALEDLIGSFAGSSGRKDIWFFRVKCGNDTCYRKATITLNLKCSKLRKPKALRFMSLTLLLIPSTMPLVVR